MGKTASDPRQRLLDAGLKLFANRGYAGTSVLDITEEAKVTKPTLYYYYGNKEGLFQALVDQAMDERLHLKRQAARAWALYLALARAAKREAQAGRPLEWTLPDGFRVLQANREEDVSGKVELWLHTWQGAKRLQARRRQLTNVLDINAQARGLPPNLIHSLDACLLRAVVREAVNVSRWAVAHDSIGVHPNDGGRLRSAIVEAIECMYGADVLASLGDWCDGIPEHPAELPASMRGGWYTFS